MSVILPSQQPFPSKRYWGSLIGIVLFGLWPVFGLLFTGLVAHVSGCQVDEGSAHPCIIMGADWGKTLYTLGVMGWFMFFTFPASALAGLVWAGSLIFHYGMWRGQQRTRRD